MDVSDKINQLEDEITSIVLIIGTIQNTIASFYRSIDYQKEAILNIFKELNISKINQEKVIIELETEREKLREEYNQELLKIQEALEKLGKKH